jgi:hypothetical protein
MPVPTAKLQVQGGYTSLGFGDAGGWPTTAKTSVVSRQPRITEPGRKEYSYTPPLWLFPHSDSDLTYWDIDRYSDLHGGGVTQPGNMHINSRLLLCSIPLAQANSVKPIVGNPKAN